MAPTLKADFHAHTRGDPFDYIPYDARELIDRAATLGYDVLSITSHGAFFSDPDVTAYAAAKGIVLVPGIEAEPGNKHVVILNACREAEAIRTFEDLRAYRERHPECFVIAPHPYYLKRHCLMGRLRRHIDLFDGVEHCHFHCRFFNLSNRLANRVAVRHGKTWVGSSDCHRLYQLDFTYTLIEAEKNISSIIAALKAGKARVVTRPLPTRVVILTSLAVLIKNPLRRLYRRIRRACG